MKKVKIVAVFLFSLLVALGCNRIKCEGTYKVEAVVTDNGLNVRDKMITGKVIAVLKKGDKVEIVKRSTTKYKVKNYNNYWYEIKLTTGATGWCFGQWLRISGFNSLEAGLMKYAGEGDICRVKYLAQMGADVNAKDYFGRMAIMYAMGKIGYETSQKKTYHNEIIKFLKSKGAVIPDMSLIDAVKQGDIEKVKQLLNQGYNINQRDYDGDTVLINAIMIKRFDIVQLLIQKGADVNTFGSHGNTPLMHSVLISDIKIIEFLLQNGAKINEENFIPHTALIFAILNKNSMIVKYLISKGANVNQYVDVYKIRPLNFALEHGNNDIIRILKKAGAKKTDIHINVD
jgi:ankyrin repeat protein